MTKRRNKAQRTGPTAASRGRIPSAPTFFRISIATTGAANAIDKATTLLAPMLWLRDRKSIEQIKQAKTVEALLDLAPTATGVAESAWRDRVSRLGVGYAPLMAERLKATRDLTDENERDVARERLIAALRWQGAAGAQALQACMDDLNDYGRSLACVAMGLIRDPSSGDAIWRFYEKVKRRSDTHFVGALWGLIDLKDPRAGAALAELLNAGRMFYELYGFLSLAGDARSVALLFNALFRAAGRKEEADDPYMALIGIAQRIGREALLAEMEKFEKSAPPASSPEQREALADRILSYPRSSLEEYFQLFYRGLTPKDVTRALSRA